MSNMTGRLQRVEKVISGDEPVTYTQAMTLTLGLLYDLWGEIEGPIKQVPENVTAIEVLKTRVTLGIGLTVLVGIVSAIVLIAGIVTKGFGV